MQREDAIALIRNEQVLLPQPQVWADLGCGTGTFTLALSSLLPPQSLIYAVDKNKMALSKIPDVYNEVNIEKQAQDFIQDHFSFTNLDGILMANSFHYVRDKIMLLNKLVGCLDENGCFLMVEYDTRAANPWVPYPIDFQSLKLLFIQMGYASVNKLNEQPSLYRQGKIYSALIKKGDI